MVVVEVRAWHCVLQVICSFNAFQHPPGVCSVLSALGSQSQAGLTVSLGAQARGSPARLEVQSTLGGSDGTRPQTHAQREHGHL